jgi:hypothetical protein
MVDRIDMSQTMLSVEPARGRQTPQNDFSSMVIRGAKRAVTAVAGGFRAAASVLPGGSFITAVADVATGMVDPEYGMGGNNDKWALLRAQERLQEEGLSNSLRLLALQRKMNQETQTYTALSNVMKARHEMSKRAINNIG